MSTKVRNAIEMLNVIIERPEEANMANWQLLGNPNDESELMFYMNSISDGSRPRYDERAETRARLLAHSARADSRSEASAVLGYLRLSLLGLNRKPCSRSPQLLVDTIDIENRSPREIRANLRYRLCDERGAFREVAAQVTFDLERSAADSESFSLYVSGIEVEGKKLYGWWY